MVPSSMQSGNDPDAGAVAVMIRSSAKYSTKKSAS
jgi:hypothetical protein